MACRATGVLSPAVPPNRGLDARAPWANVVVDRTDAERSVERYRRLRRIERDCHDLAVADRRRRVLARARDSIGIPLDDHPATVLGERSDLDELDSFSVAFLTDLLQELPETRRTEDPDTGFLGFAPRIVAIRSRVGELARTHKSVLILGERGTGKGQLVRAIGSRLQVKVLTVPLATVPKDVADAELFGHRKGAFTGAHTDRPGIFLEAKRAGKLLYLDDVAECPPTIQVKLLTALDDGAIRSVGSDKSIEIGRGAARGFRIVSSSQPGSLSKLRFDLRDRLGTLQVWIPRLESRGLDTLLLAEHFARAEVGETNRNNVFSRAAHRLLLEYSWPGNVRQLSNVVASAVFEAGGSSRISASTVENCIDGERRLHHAAEMGTRTEEVGVGQEPDAADDGLDAGRFPTMAEVRDRHFEKALEHANGNITKAARLLGFHRSTVQRWCNKRQ